MRQKQCPMPEAFELNNPPRTPPPPHDPTTILSKSNGDGFGIKYRSGFRPIGHRAI